MNSATRVRESAFATQLSLPRPIPGGPGGTVSPGSPLRFSSLAFLPVLSIRLALARRQCTPSCRSGIDLARACVEDGFRRVGRCHATAEASTADLVGTVFLARVGLTHLAAFVLVRHCILQEFGQNSSIRKRIHRARARNVA